MKIGRVVQLPGLPPKLKKVKRIRMEKWKKATLAGKITTNERVKKYSEVEKREKREGRG